MYKVLIADDEPLIREGLRTIVEWEEHGFEVAGSAADGREALDLAAKLEPDLMIVDIRMPGMDGLTLMRSVRERARRRPHFLVLSGHADFEYARQALDMRAEGYMLKPVDEDELAEHLARLKTALDEEKTASAAPAAERIAAALLSGEGGAVPEEAKAGAGFDASSYELVLIRLQSREEIDREKIDAVRRKLAEAYASPRRGIVLSLDPYVGLVLKDAAGDAGALDAAWREIARACAGEGLDFTAVSGGPSVRPEELSRSYRGAREGMRRRFLLEGDKVHVRLPNADGGASAGAEAAAERPEAPDLAAAAEKLSLSLDIGSATAAAEQIRSAGDDMLRGGMTEREIKAAFVQMLTLATGALARNRPEAKEKAHAFTAEVTGVYAEYRYSGLIERLARLVGEMARQLGDGGGDKQVQRMIELIRRNYEKNLKLESLAELFSYNSSYLGKLFKSTTGVSFNTYLDQVRIDKAKELLAEGMKVYQVAERVGYSNVDYFHGKFRKYVGVSPSEYRKSLH
ncbi:MULTISPECIES: response regulator transcription factor [Cohnella]|uniref:response regulator transcription factor n=1 Tax=Cohnella TaxID=329857 RepID=UPI0009BB4810|nr:MULTISPECIES: response regulator [Cohnella]MBN2982123.1 response regulator [Cohnella algarum]